MQKQVWGSAGKIICLLSDKTCIFRIWQRLNWLLRALGCTTFFCICSTLFTSRSSWITYLMLGNRSMLQLKSSKERSLNVTPVWLHPFFPGLLPVIIFAFPSFFFTFCLSSRGWFPEWELDCCFCSLYRVLTKTSSSLKVVCTSYSTEVWTIWYST